ncbi:unnamed protein product [Xylocopa violacea]|uniref:Uncharacterized protein n=1 Tax=Xylocopa violacea TaxID=135666 RepID=A0ABP1PLE9_XYLVO
MSLLYVLGRSSSFFSSAAKTTAATSNKIGKSFMISMTARRKREEGESRPSVPLKRKEKKMDLRVPIKTGWVRFSCRHFIAVHGAGSSFVPTKSIYGLSPLEPPVTKESFASPDSRSSELLRSLAADVYVHWIRYIWCATMYISIYRSRSHTLSKLVNRIESTTKCIRVDAYAYVEVGYRLVYSLLLLFLLLGFLGFLRSFVPFVSLILPMIKLPFFFLLIFSGIRFMLLTILKRNRDVSTVTNHSLNLMNLIFSLI